MVRFVFITLFFVIGATPARAEKPLGYFDAEGPGTFDFNGDGKAEKIIVDRQNCGSGGCSYQVTDGKTKKIIADLFAGTTFVSAQRINGWPVLNLYAHGSAESGTYMTVIFDGTNYVEVSRVFLKGDSVTALFDQNKSVRRLGGR